MGFELSGRFGGPGPWRRDWYVNIPRPFPCSPDTRPWSNVERSATDYWVRFSRKRRKTFVPYGLDP